MRLALEQATQAELSHEVPIGAVIALGDRLVCVAHNSTIMLHDPTAHAEIIAIRKACQTLRNHRLNFCTLYVTLEPCTMCWSAVQHARLREVIFATASIRPDTKYPCIKTHAVAYSERSKVQLQSFFQKRR